MERHAAEETIRRVEDPVQREDEEENSLRSYLSCSSVLKLLIMNAQGFNGCKARPPDRYGQRNIIECLCRT